MATTKSESEEHAHHTTHAQQVAKRSNTPLLAAAAIIVVVVIVAGYLYSTSGIHKSPSVVTSIVTTTVPGGSVTQIAAPGSVPVANVIAILSASPTPANYTVNYNGIISSAASDVQTSLNGTVVYSYMKNGNFSRSDYVVNVPIAPAPIESILYYASNGLITSCMQISASSYNCTHTATNLTPNEFRLSSFLAIADYANTKVQTANSSYNGIGCLQISGSSDNSISDNGIVLLRETLFSACISKTYKVPLYLNLTSAISESGSYMVNGTKQTLPPYQQETQMLLHEVMVSNSSSANYVTSLPANAMVLN